MKQEVYEVILDSIADGVFTVDRSFVLTSFNRAAERITGFSREDAIGQRCFHVFRAGVCQTSCFLRQTMASGQNLTGIELTILDRHNREKLISISTAPLRDRRGRIVGGVETFRDISEVDRLRREVKHQYRLDDMVSKNHLMQEIFSVLPDLAASDASVLIRGDTGTGKEVLAHSIHRLSPRGDGPLVKVNCAALPDTLLESELFGHVAGAFTDAKRDRAGRFARADGGTIFLDEIGDISPAMQVRLLQVVQEKRFEPVGSSKPVQVDIRILSSTHRDLETLVAAGDFRRDLYYRLNVVPIALPSLRERPEDIPLLIEHFLEKYRALTGKPIRSVDPGVLSVCLEHDFPGNIRELEHAVEHAFVLCRDETIRVEHLPLSLRRRVMEQAPAPPASLKDREREAVADALRRNGYNKIATARELGLSRTTLWRKMKALGIPLDGR